MLRIGVFSKLSKVSIRMLRHYDELGLLKPAHIDPDSGYRFYGEEQLLTAGRINALKDMGFGLAAIGQLLPCGEDRVAMERALLLKQAELQEVHAWTEERLRLLDTALERLRKDEPMKYDVTRKTFPERYAATVRMTIPNYDREGMLWDILMAETASMKLVYDEPCYCSAVFHDREYKETDVDVEVQQTLKGSYPDTKHVRFRTLPPVTVASATCKGSYELMGEVNAAVARWISDNGYELSGPIFNIYHVSPHETSDHNELVTEVCYPIKKKEA